MFDDVMITLSWMLLGMLFVYPFALAVLQDVGSSKEHREKHIRVKRFNFVYLLLFSYLRTLFCNVDDGNRCEFLLVSDIVVEIDGMGGFSCYGVGVPEPSITWQRTDGIPLPSHFAQDADGNLRVKGRINR